jgi:hypothetical protein
MFRFIPALALFLTLAIVPASVKADAGSAVLEARFHAALNEVVQEVHGAKTTSEKRDILQKFLTRFERGLEKAQAIGSLKDEDRQALRNIQKKFYAYDSELNGAQAQGIERVADANLDAFAGYIQQDMEQAPVGGGIYISAGTLIIILLILIIIF